MKNLKSLLVGYLVVAMFIIGITPRCFAGFSPSEVIARSQTERSYDLGEIQKFLETKMVRERLGQLGFAPEEIREKLSTLNEAQIHQLALHLDELKIGGDAGEVVIIFLLVGILVVLLIYATGHKIVIQ